MNLYILHGKVAQHGVTLTTVNVGRRDSLPCVTSAQYGDGQPGY